MELKHIKGIGPSKQEKLSAAGVKDVDDLARCDVAAVAKATGMTEATVREYKQKAAALALLENIKGVGPATVKALAENGIRSLKDLASASAERIAKEAKVAQNKAEAWKHEAEVTLKRVAEEAKTAEGRKKLAAEGKELAEKTATRAKESTEKLVHQAKDLSDAGIEKAKEIQEKAPKAIKDATDKATATAKEVEVKVKEVADKVQTTAKAEAEKVKAANEGFIARLKGKFARKKQNA